MLFKNLKARRESFAIVLDEHGGMEGVVTITDILECIVGDFDEDTLSENNGRPDIEQTGENEWQIVGSALISDVCEELEVDIPDEDYDTFGGYVLSILGAVPADNSRFTLEDDDLIINVVSVQDHRIELTTVTKKERKEDGEKAEDEA